MNHTWRDIAMAEKLAIHRETIRLKNQVDATCLLQNKYHAIASAIKMLSGQSLHLNPSVLVRGFPMASHCAQV